MTEAKPVDPAHTAVSAPSETRPRYPLFEMTWRKVARTITAASGGSTWPTVSMSWRIT